MNGAKAYTRDDITRLIREDAARNHNVPLEAVEIVSQPFTPQLEVRYRVLPGERSAGPFYRFPLGDNRLVCVDRLTPDGDCLVIEDAFERRGKFCIRIALAEARTLVPATVAEIRKEFALRNERATTGWVNRCGVPIDHALHALAMKAAA